MTLFRGRYRVETARHRSHDYSQPGFYFVTICTREMKCTLSSICGQSVRLSAIGEFAEQHWREVPSHYSNIGLDEFVIMPNHIHGLIRIEGVHRFAPDLRPVRALAAPSLGQIVGGFKAGVSRWCRANAFFEFAWQARFYDEIIRSSAGLHAVREYIRSNPENWATDDLYRAST